MLGLAFPDLNQCEQFSSDPQLVLILPHHSLAEVDILVGLKEMEETPVYDVKVEVPEVEESEYTTEKEEDLNNEKLLFNPHKS